MSTRLMWLIIGVWAVGVWTMAAGAAAVTFSSAINNGNGGTFNLNAGQTYTGGILIQGNTTVNGNGATVQLGTGEFIRCGAGTTVTFRNFTITGGNGVTLGFDGVNFARFNGDGMTITGTAGSGVEAERGRVNLTGCTISGRVYGIHCYNGATLESVIGCSITGQSDSGIYLNGTAALDIRDSYIANCKKNGILALNSPQVSISGTLFENHRNSTQAFALSLQHSQNVVIGGNSTVRNSDRGIFLRNCPNAIVRDTKVEDCFYLDGISLQDGTTATIERCEVSLCQSGVAIVNGSSGTVKDSYLHNNLKKQTTPILGQGMFILDASSAIIQGCTIVNNDNEGIFTRHSQFLVVEDCVIMDNGWVAQDGNGVFCDNTPGFIRNNKVIHNYLKGIQARTQQVVIEGNEVRQNGRGGITILDAPGVTLHVNENLVRANGSQGGSDEEFNVTGNGTIANAANNLFSNSAQIGVLIQSGGYVNLRGNIIRNNANNAVNLFNGNARIENNVIFSSQRLIYHNGANASEGSFNDIFAGSISGVEAINCSSCPLDYRNNWWGHPTGPRTQANQSAQGVYADNVSYSPFLTAPQSGYAVFEGVNIPANAWQTYQLASLPWAKFSVRSPVALGGQYLAAQASRNDLFVRIAKPFHVPADTIYLYVLGSYEIRREPQEARIEVVSGGGQISNVAAVTGFKYNKTSGEWEKLPTSFSAATQTMNLHVDDIQGLYLISPSGTLRTGNETYSNQFYVY